MGTETSAFNRIIVALTGLTVLTSCAIIGPSRTVEVLSPNGAIGTINLTPRHYRAMEHCEDALEKIPPPLLASLSHLTSEQRQKLKWPARVAGYRMKDCRSFKKRGQILNDFAAIFSAKTQKIGVILPPPGGSEGALNLILDQIKVELTRAGFSPEKALVVRRVDKSLDATLKIASELVHMDRVSIIVGGLNQVHANAISQIADQTQTPALIVNSNAPLGRTAQSMRVYPPVKRLAARLVEVFRAQGVQEAFVFYPQGANLELYDLMRAIPGAGISYSVKTYDPSNSASILMAVKSQSGNISDARGRPAVIILDNFRMVRHIVNIISTSLPSRNILFAGNQQWRSPALVVPRDDAMQGAVFVDFIGSYRNLPDQIDTPISDNAYFTTAQAASRIDYQIIGHRLGSLVVEAARFGIGRHLTASRLQSMKNSWDSYFPPKEAAIDAQRDSSWPVFLFEVSGETIKEL